MSAIGQVERTAVFRRTTNRKLPSKRWAVASRWGTEQNGRNPTLIAWDPYDGDLEDDDFEELERILSQADLQAVAAGMGYSKGIGALSPSLTVEEGLVDLLLVGADSSEPGLIVAIGPLGVVPVRNQNDLDRVSRARELVPSIALATLSAAYIRSVREGVRPGDDDQVLKDRTASHRGLTVTWPEQGETITIKS